MVKSRKLLFKHKKESLLQMFTQREQTGVIIRSTSRVASSPSAPSAGLSENSLSLFQLLSSHPHQLYQAPDQLVSLIILMQHKLFIILLIAREVHRIIVIKIIVIIISLYLMRKRNYLIKMMNKMDKIIEKTILRLSQIVKTTVMMTRKSMMTMMMNRMPIQKLKRFRGTTATITKFLMDQEPTIKGTGVKKR